MGRSRCKQVKHTRRALQQPALPPTLVQARRVAARVAQPDVKPLVVRGKRLQHRAGGRHQTVAAPPWGTKRDLRTQNMPAPHSWCQHHVQLWDCAEANWGGTTGERRPLLAPHLRAHAAVSHPGEAGVQHSVLEKHHVARACAAVHIRGWCGLQARPVLRSLPSAPAAGCATDPGCKQPHRCLRLPTPPQTVACCAKQLFKCGGTPFKCGGTSPSSSPHRAAGCGTSAGCSHQAWSPGAPPGDTQTAQGQPHRNCKHALRIKPC